MRNSFQQANVAVSYTIETSYIFLVVQFAQIVVVVIVIIKYNITSWNFFNYIGLTFNLFFTLCQVDGNLEFSTLEEVFN